MLHRYLYLLSLIALISLILGACVYKPKSDLSALATPNSGQVLSSVPTPLMVISPKPGYATICGTLVLTNPALVAPIEDGLYLVSVDTSTQGSIIVPRVDAQTSYRAAIDEVTGQFCFEEVRPGVYAVIAVTDAGSEISVRSFETGQVVLITISQKDLNTIFNIGALRLP